METSKRMAMFNQKSMSFDVGSSIETQRSTSTNDDGSVTEVG